MKPLVSMLTVGAAALVLTGCWSNMELTDRGFVQAAAIDAAPGLGGYRLTTQVYKPGGAMKESPTPSSQNSYIAIMTENRSLLGAVRDATNDLGRKLQLSHMRALLISDQIAKTRHIGQLLDFFTRDHEPRGDVSVIITEGSAGRYLLIPPFIESTLGQQLKEIEHKSSSYSGKSIPVTLTDLDIRSKSEVPMAIVPYFRLQKDHHRLSTAHGLAIVDFSGGMMSGYIPPPLTPYTLILMNVFAGGVVDLPCEGGGGKNSLSDSFEILKVGTKIRPVVRGDALTIGIQVRLEGSIGELGCRKAVTREEIAAFNEQVAQFSKDRLGEALERLQKEKADVIGVGEQLSRYRPHLWQRWKPGWPKRFADADSSIQVHVKLLNTGVQSGESPFVKSESQFQ
ncbi:Ger(x)C family spore germination protein [Cohnella hongkongensis]|uniref:Ger(X)C family spore germination protein n=1 Tax=Cohnella hongkongensis TaxID=178337 RepID=A0ABV9F784_9BACL